MKMAWPHGQKYYIGTLNLIFCSTAFGGSNCSHMLSVTLNKVSTLSDMVRMELVSRGPCQVK